MRSTEPATVGASGSQTVSDDPKLAAAEGWIAPPAEGSIELFSAARWS